MSVAFPRAKLREAAEPVSRPVTPAPGETYRQLGVSLWGKGAYEREPVDGGITKYQQLFRAEQGDIVVNKIWARNGSVGVVDADLAGCHGSNEFPMFAPIHGRLDPRWMHWITKTKDFWAQCDQKSQGTSGQNRIKPERFLEVEIPLPPLDEQRRIVARIEALAAKVEEARGLRIRTIEETPLLVDSFLREQFAKLKQQHGVVALDEVLVDATYGTSEKSHGERVAGALPVLRIPNVASEKLDLTNLKYAALNDNSVASLALCDDDILIVRTNGSADLVGRSAVVRGLSEPTLFASYLIRLRFDGTRLLSDFAQIGLRHLRRSGSLIDFARTTAGQYNVSIGRLRGAALPIAPLREQRRIIAELDALQAKVDAAKSLQTDTAAELDAMLPAILDQAFKGEL